MSLSSGCSLTPTSLAIVTMRSTSGVFLTLYGPHTFYPLDAQSKTQTAVSHSTVEAELVAADHAIRTSGASSLATMGDGS